MKIETARTQVEVAAAAVQAREVQKLTEEGREFEDSKQRVEKE
jgi:hypothetical protein